LTTDDADRDGLRKLMRTMKYCSRCGATVSLRVPADDTRERWICDRCDTIHYQNPLIVVGCVATKDDRVLLCKRAIEPRYGHWTVPAGFMELGESLAEGAAGKRSKRPVPKSKLAICLRRLMSLTRARCMYFS